MKQEVIHGDCLEVMKDIPDKSINIILQILLLILVSTTAIMAYRGAKLAKESYCRQARGFCDNNPYLDVCDLYKNCNKFDR